MADRHVPDPEWPSSETVYGLPRSHWHCHLQNFDWDLLPEADAVRAGVGAFTTEHDAGEAPHLILHGPRGTGKSHLGVALHRREVYRKHLAAAAWIHVPSFCKAVKRSWTEGGDPFDPVRRAGHLVMDDLFGRELSDWELSQVVTELIDGASQRRQSLVVTLNHDLDRVRALLQPHEVSRLLERALVVRVRGEDRRL